MASSCSGVATKCRILWCETTMTLTLYRHCAARHAKVQAREEILGDTPAAAGARGARAALSRRSRQLPPPTLALVVLSCMHKIY